ncbi:uncharacterized protein BDCG_06591 [Blastomyces dermatitidis ER-3]|uniref:Uncharacterized protein n=2 Tax=Blastomyces TaxID=229219 RepID=A0A179UQM3_BLAGS|nr:uncharacterized protein BDBG_05169 [Blastomyces gilchristii SLH14081]XP_045278003.1 uncharacterized protein BDCG_06591 [Blastomyces dermatitidis ER-3]EEQ91471.1 hypothetical protein BDCG_06591 [Blastomyces dermatitidis ER-3]OAT09377.1 hypothetical protein BDBG_05169 [Blastomyces gilchristii SLH14081]
MAQNTYHPPPFQSDLSVGQETGTFNQRSEQSHTADAATQHPPTDSPNKGTTAGTTARTTAGTRAGTTTGSGLGHGIKSAVAGVHGLGENIRGNVNAAVDRAMKDPEGVRKNETIAIEGEREVETGEFSRATKARESGHEYDTL